MLFFKNKRFAGSLWAFLFLAYPFLVYYFADNFPKSYWLSILLTFLLLRAILPLFNRNTTLNFIQKSSLFLALFMTILMGGLSLWKKEIAPLLYPAGMSLTITCIFGSTLFYPPSMVERFARFSDPNLDEAGIAYTWNVTFIWTIFCFMNAILSLMTVVIDDLQLWALYNGCISYVLMGLLMVGEYCFRRYSKRRTS